MDINIILRDLIAKINNLLYELTRRFFAGRGAAI